MSSIEELDQNALRQLAAIVARRGGHNVRLESAAGDETHRYYMLHVRYSQGYGFDHRYPSAEAFYDDTLPGNPWRARFITTPARKNSWRRILAIILIFWGVVAIFLVVLMALWPGPK